MSIEKRPLGNSGDQVTVLGYGSMELRGPPRGRDLTEKEVGHVLNAVLDAGINVIDTSIDYELSEERIGRHLSHRRDEFLLASKCGCLVGWERPADYKGGMPGGGPHDFSRDNIVSGVEQSLRRLQTDYLDVLQVHASPHAATLEKHDVVGTLQDLKASGKVRLIGMSGVLPAVSDHIAMSAFDVFQMPYSLLQREHEKAINDAEASGAGVFVRGGVARGAPSGATRRNPELVDRWNEAEVEELLDGLSPMEFTLRFTISHPGVSSVLVGTVNPDHLEANIEAASKGPLPPDVYTKAKERLG